MDRKKNRKGIEEWKLNITHSLKRARLTAGIFFVIWKAFPLGHPKVLSVAFYDAKKGTFVNRSFEGAFNVTAWAFMESKSNA